METVLIIIGSVLGVVLIVGLVAAIALIRAMRSDT